MLMSESVEQERRWMPCTLRWLILALLTLAGVFNLQATNYHVATNGNNLNAGTLAAPFATIQRAVTSMGPGDVCLIRGGTYHEAVSFSGKNNLTFRAFPGEVVLMDGTLVITSPWTNHAGNISSTTSPTDIWQLFADGELVMPARWPNASLQDGTVWDQENHWAKLVWSTDKTTMQDQATGHSDLAALPFSVVDAMAVLNVGSFKSYTRQINAHTPGSDTFTVDAVGNKKASNYQFYFLEGKLEFLDVPNEWHYDPVTSQLYYWGDTNAVIRGKVQDYAFQVVNSDNITIRGIHFFATALYFSGSDGALVADCSFEYPSCTKRMLGVQSSAPQMNTFQGGAGNVFSNNVVRYPETPAVYMNNGTGNLIDNCLFEYIDWSCADLPNLMGTVYMRGTGSTFRRNTVHTTGASEFLDLNNAPLVELNRISNIGLVQNDGSMIQLTINAQPNSETAYNWFMDSDKYGARFDASTAAGSPTGSDGLMHHNVGFNMKSAIMQKGDYHRCLNNTALDTSNNGIIILDDSISDNDFTITRNNAAEKLSGARSSYLSVPGVADHNWNGYQNGNADLRTVLRDPDNLDFRPQSGSALVDAGTQIAGITDGFLGAAPDIGAYESGASHYWIPGRRQDTATTPVPPDRATSVKSNADLMWLEGLGASLHRVYFGTDPFALPLQSEQTNNLFKPGDLVAGTTYFWRVDEVTGQGIKTGSTWSFVAGPGALSPRINLQITNQLAVIRWEPATGTLEAASQPAGPWAPVATNSPHAEPLGSGVRFYRVGP
jgi:hypothetical protein